MPKRDPEIGATGQVELIVGEADLASALSPISGDPYPAVFATTQAIALCELAAGRVLAPLLSKGELSVGVIVDVKHTAAPPPGARVSATARYTGREAVLVVAVVVGATAAGVVFANGAEVVEASVFAALRPRSRAVRLSSSWLPASRPREDWFMGMTSSLPTFTWR